jgi:DNA-binding response OmpR family regulator
MKPRILVIDKNNKLFSDMKELLRFKGYDVDFMSSGEIRAHYELRQYSLIILGVLPSTPRMYNKLKKYAASILCVADQSSLQSYEYLSSGTSNYILKPFTPDVFIARIQQVLEGTSGNATPQRENIEEVRIGPLAIRPTTREIRVANRWISCTPKTFDLFCHFVRNPNRLFSRQDLINTVWNSGFAGAQRTVDAHVKELRRKIEEAGFTDAQIVTVFGKGYMFLMPA